MSQQEIEALTNAKTNIYFYVNEVVNPILERIYQIAPDLFPKPFKEMGISDKVKFIEQLLKLIKVGE